MSNLYPSGWNAILPINKLNKKMLTLNVLGINLLLWKDSLQNISVMEDLCPHRSAKLSLGKVIDDNIICPYHGFKFNNRPLS